MARRSAIRKTRWGVLDERARQRVRRDRERLYFKTNDIQMAVILFVEFVANKNK